MRFSNHSLLSKEASWLLKLCFSLGAFWFALHDVDLLHVFHILATQHSSGILWTVIFLILQIILGAFRWRTILGTIGKSTEKIFSFVEAIKLYYISVFFNCCLPGTVGGDVVRVWLTKSDDISLHTAITSVIIDRLIALIALAILIIATLPALGDVAHFNSLFLVVTLPLLFCFGFWFMLRIRQTLTRFEHITVVQWILHFITCLQLLLVKPKTTLIALFYAIISHLCFCLCIYALAHAIGHEISLLQCITLVPLVMLAITLPISIGGWGVREVSMVGMLALAGIPKAGALMISLEYGVINILVSLPAALLWLLYRKQKNDNAQ